MFSYLICSQTRSFQLLIDLKLLRIITKKINKIVNFKTLAGYY